MKYWMLFPWYINAKMGMADYEKEIPKYNEFFKADTFNSILNADMELTEKHTNQGIEHYKYHQEIRVKDKRNIRFNRFQLMTFENEQS